MADKRGGEHTHESFGQRLGALLPGGSVTLGFDDYARLFGTDPTEDELEGERAAGSLAAKHNCEHKVDHAKRMVFFSKKK